jgi:hypothetical protein
MAHYILQKVTTEYLDCGETPKLTRDCSLVTASFVRIKGRALRRSSRKGVTHTVSAVTWRRGDLRADATTRVNE